MAEAHSSKKEDQEVLAFEIAVPVKLVPEKTLYLHEEIANGTWGEEKFHVERTLPGNSIVIQVAKKRYRLDLSTMVESVLKAQK